MRSTFSFSDELLCSLFPLVRGCIQHRDVQMGAAAPVTGQEVPLLHGHPQGELLCLQHSKSQPPVWEVKCAETHESSLFREMLCLFHSSKPNRSCSWRKAAATHWLSGLLQSYLEICSWWVWEVGVCWLTVSSCLSHWESLKPQWAAAGLPTWQPSSFFTLPDQSLSAVLSSNIQGEPYFYSQSKL